jgi:hypothetical protein
MNVEKVLLRTRKGLLRIAAFSSLIFILCGFFIDNHIHPLPFVAVTWVVYGELDWIIRDFLKDT